MPVALVLVAVCVSFDPNRTSPRNRWEACFAIRAARDGFVSFRLFQEQTGRAYVELEGGVFTGTVVDDEYVFRVTQTWTVIEPSPGETGCYVTLQDALSIVLHSSEIDDLRTASGFDEI